jgi:hypothetical protein
MIKIKPFFVCISDEPVNFWKEYDDLLTVKSTEYKGQSLDF